MSQRYSLSVTVGISQQYSLSVTVGILALIARHAVTSLGATLCCVCLWLAMPRLNATMILQSNVINCTVVFM
jgi:hypothetical protein